MKREKFISILASVIPILLIFVLWVVVAVCVNNAYLLPSLLDTLKEFINMFTYSDFYLSLLFTLLRSFVSFAVSYVLAFALAILSVKNKFYYKAVSPVVSILRALPTVAVVLILLVWTNSYIAPVIVTVLVVLPVLFTDIRNALLSLNDKETEMCNLFNVPKRDILLKVKLPQILPEILRSCGSGLSLNVKLMVAAEVLAFTSNSIGNLMFIAKEYYQTTKLFALVLAVIIIGIIVERVFEYFAKRKSYWK